MSQPKPALNIPTAITMKHARRIYRRTFWKTITIQAPAADARAVEIGGYPASSPSFRQWARMNTVWLKASNKHPIGKLARIMGAS